MELLFILYKPKLQGGKQPSKKYMSHFFGKYQIFLDRLKDSTQIKRNCVKTFDVRHDAKHYRAPQGITGLMKMQVGRIISFFKWFEILWRRAQRTL